ncbi:MAG TPA: histidine phosphatase family protein [Candidatus Limnocylindria bacterium]|nr:histidine phosphatase family protein [Candidatus Limnocylindria bacterium]
MTDRLLLIRHGVTTWNREGRFQGHLDAPLGDDGRLEASLLGERLAGEDLAQARLVTSPLGRAAETARIVARAAGLRGPESDSRLMEIGQGEWEGRTHAELVEQDGERYAAWRARAGEDQPPGAETIAAALERVSAALDELGADLAPTICVVSHGGLLRLAARHLLSLQARRAWLMDVDNASLSELQRVGSGDGWRLVRWNDTAHLLGRTSQHLDETEGEPLAL